jgi:hypothetical protein
MDSSQKKFLLLWILKTIALILVVAISCIVFAGTTDSSSGRGNCMHRKTIEEVLKENNSKLLSVPGVVGTAESLCESNPCIKVYVIQISDEFIRQIPQIIDGYPVVVEEIGKIHTLPEN